MSDRVLILGGQGRIGSSVAADVLAHTNAQVTVTGRIQRPPYQDYPRPVEFLSLKLEDHAAVAQAIAQADLVIHCAGPFSYRDGHVLDTCIQQGVNYLDVADNPPYVKNAIAQRQRAEAAGVTAIVSTGVFPGISNSMARQSLEQLDQADHLQLNYVVSGSGGAGVTVMRTTFLELQHPIKARIDGQWQTIQPYSQREVVDFPQPYGRCGVYWFNTVEAMTLAESFPLQTVITKFGSAPDFYNHLTWMMAHWLPKRILKRPDTVEFLAKVSYGMTEFTDRFTGIGVAMQVVAQGQKDGQPARHISSVVHQDTATSAGYGTGSVAELVLSGQLCKPGVWPVETAVPTDLFEQTMEQRGLKIEQLLTS